MPDDPTYWCWIASAHPVAVTALGPETAARHHALIHARGDLSAIVDLAGVTARPFEQLVHVAARDGTEVYTYKIAIGCDSSLVSKSTAADG